MLSFDIYSIIQAIITGIFAGFCSAIGSYFANRGFIRHLDKIGKNNIDKKH